MPPRTRRRNPNQKVAKKPEEPCDRFDASSGFQEPWIPGLIERIVSFLPRNEVALTIRRLNKATAQLLATHHVMRAAEPLPAHEYARLPETLVHRSTVSQRRQIVCGAAHGGSLAAVQAALKVTGLAPGAWLFTAAAGAPGPGVALALCNSMEAMRCPLHSQTYENLSSTLCAAAAAGNADVCDWLLAGGRCSWGAAAALAAARGGHANLAQRLLYLCPQADRGGCAVHELLTEAAHGCGAADLEQTYCYWLGRRAEQLQQWRQVEMQEQQPQQGQQLQQQRGSRLFKRGDPVGRFGPAYVERRDGFCCAVADAQFLDMLAAAAGSPTGCWLTKLDALLRLHCDETSAQLASGGRDDAALVRLYTAAAGRPDGLDRLRLMWEQRRWVPSAAADLERVVEAAAARGDVPALRYVLDTMGAGAQLRWGAGCPGSAPPPLRAAATAGSLEALRLLVGCYGSLCCCDWVLSDMIDTAASKGHLGVIEWLRQEAGKPRSAGAGPAGAGECERRAELQKFLKRKIGACVFEEGVVAGRPEVLRWGLDHGARVTQERSFTWWPVAARVGCVEALRMLAEVGAFKPGAEPYCNLDGDRLIVRELSRLRLGGKGAVRGLAALLEDPDVPLSELRWLLEGDKQGAEEAFLAALGATKGKAMRIKEAAYSVRACAVLGGPAAEGLRYGGEWHLALQALARRGEGPEAQEIRAWLEQWRGQQAGRLLPGKLRL
ncbi:hypothetical protein HYH02_000065 [Chlamydomonas schloesseri]|uniref:Uncharacterized protein n=1 Tax=Chlamydomonas schloesseri TaxID=2026947 RepID=A0A836B7F9_9CHLO|nr:hypothetical protein HYH02_000065 [Chlamydomonas schloesseri]|eukprot:KAG2449961.1 hypothetical protein HYH02_000065 [Chlamydomonas schloesseri]